MTKKRKNLRDLKLFRPLEERIAFHGVGFNAESCLINEGTFPTNPNFSLSSWRQNMCRMEEEMKEDFQRQKHFLNMLSGKEDSTS